MKLIDYIPSGAANAVTAEELSILTGLNRRQVTRCIEILRQMGEPICASCSTPMGYYMAENAGELAQYVKALHSRALNILKTHRALKSKLDAMDGSQIAMEGFNEQGFSGLAELL